MNYLRKISLLVKIGLVILATSLGTIAGAAAKDNINIGVLRFTSHSAAFIAYEKGYFQGAGLTAKLVPFQAAAPMAVAIASGDIDYGVTAISGALVNLAEKGAIRIIGGALTEEKGVDGQKILVSNKAYAAGVRKASDLKGRSFGLTQTGSSFHYMASQIAKKEGFSSKEMSLKPLQKVGAIIGALKSGQIDAWSIVPHIAKALNKSGGAKIIGDVADYIDGYQITTIFTSKNNADNKRALTKRFLSAYSKGIKEFKDVMVDKKRGVSAIETTTRLIHKYVYTSRPYKKAAGSIQAGSMRLQPDGRLNLTSVKHQLEWFKAEKLVPASASIKNLVDASYVKTY